MNKKWFIFVIVIVLISTLTGCAMNTKSQPATHEYEQGINAPAPAEAVRDEESKVATSSVAGTAGTDATVPNIIAAERKVIYTVSMSLIVKDTQTTFDQLVQVTQKMGGYVADSNTWKDNEQLRGTVTVRIPADNLEQALCEFRALASDVESEKMDSQDVTEEYVDLESRLTAEQRTEQELLELLETRSATGKTSDILEVYRELAAARARIEQIQGRMKYLSNLSAMATVQISLIPDTLVQPVVVAGWHPEGTARDAIRMLLKTLQVFADIAIVFFLYILPILIVIAIPVTVVVWVIILVWKGIKRRKAAKAAK